MLDPEIKQTTPFTTCMGLVNPILIKEIPALQPPLWKPDARQKKVFERAPSPSICYQKRLSDTVSSLNLMNPELINLAKGWLQGYMDLLLSDRKRLFQGQEENKIKSQLKKLLEKCRGKRINLKGLTRGNLRLLFLLSQFRQISVRLENLDDYQKSEAENFPRFSTSSLSDNSFQHANFTYCQNVRALYYIPPNSACNERFTGLTIEGLLRLDEALKEKLSKQKHFGLIYTGYCRHVVNLNSLSETDRLKDFKPAKGAELPEERIFDPIFLHSCFRKQNGAWQVTTEGIVVVSKLYLLTRLYPELLDIAFISVLGIPLSLREFFEIVSVDKLFRLCRGGYESTPLPVEETCSVSVGAYLFGHTINGQLGRELVIFVENDDFAPKRAGALYYLLVAAMQDNPDLFKDFRKIHIVFNEGSSLKRFSMTLGHDI